MTEETTRDSFNLYGLILIAIVCVIIVLGLYFFNFHGELSEKPDVWGQFSDYAGGLLNPIISFLALIAFMRSMRQQHTELKQTITEMANSRQRDEIFRVLEWSNNELAKHVINSKLNKEPGILDNEQIKTILSESTVEKEVQNLIAIQDNLLVAYKKLSNDGVNVALQINALYPYIRANLELIKDTQ